MAGHSKWANVKHEKVPRIPKEKIFTKLIKEITVAVKASGYPMIQIHG